MAQNQPNSKFKIANLAKNFDLKSKELVDLLTEAGIAGKTHMGTLEPEEFNIFLEFVARSNTVDDIDKYMSRPAPEEAPKAAVSASADAAAPAPAQPEEQGVQPPAPEKKAQPERTETKEEQRFTTMTASVQLDDDSINLIKAEQERQRQRAQRAAAEKAAAEKEALRKAEADRLAAQKAAEEARQKQQQTSQAPQGQRPQQPVQQPQAQRPQIAQIPQGQQQRPQAKPALTPQQILQKRPPQPLTPPRQIPVQQRQSAPQQTTIQRPVQSRPAQAPRVASNTPITPVNIQSPRQQSRREFTIPVQLRDPKKNEPAKKQVRQQPSWQQKSDGNVHTTVDVITTDSIKLEAGVKSEESKIVDTRTSIVDLSKFDEKLDNFVDSDKTRPAGDDRRKKSRPGQQKVVYDRSGRPIDKEKLALEKLRLKQQELEKAKKKQLSIILPDEIVVSDLASKLHVTTGEVVKKLFMLGQKASVNENIDYETAALVAMEFGAKVEKEVILTIEDKLFDDSADTEAMLVPRAPVVVVMGHVDHGKTSLLDAIKDTNVTAGEAGGITQHIGAYRVAIGGREITFLDTPGHAAFTAMRARGASVTDIAILVVAGDDGIMPQTIEAINHAKAANVSIIVAINKMDKPQSDAEKVKQELTKYELVPEDWGGDIICVPVSAITKQGIDNLLEMVLLTADMKELKANPGKLAKGVIIEAKLDKGRGPVATVLVQNGTLNTGDIVIAGTTVGRVRAMNDDRGMPVRSAGPSIPVEIIGLSETPNAGDSFRAVEDERMARELVDQRKTEEKEEQFKANSNITLEDLFNQVSSGVKELNLIIKADVQGSVEALRASLIKESSEEVKIKVIHSGVGGINESDVMLASASNAIIIGFNVRPDKASVDAAEIKGVDMRTYRIIYECIEEINAAMKGMLAPKFKEVVYGRAQVRQTIRVPNIGTIAGSYVQDGKIVRNSHIRIVRDGIIIFEDKIASLRRFKDDVREVAQGFECGVGLEKFNDIRELDILESFNMEQIAAQ